MTAFLVGLGIGLLLPFLVRLLCWRITIWRHADDYLQVDTRERRRMQIEHDRHR